jgi:hypothetical protein
VLSSTLLRSVRSVGLSVASILRLVMLDTWFLLAPMELVKVIIDV